MKILGIDIGTTGICGVVADTSSGEMIKNITRKNTSFISSENDFERIQDADSIFDIVFGIIDELFDEEISAIGFSGQMHGILYTNENGKALSPLYIWQDQRGAKEYKDGRTYAEYLGCFPGYGLASDLYNEANGLIPDDAKYLCTIADWIVMRLCELDAPLIHITNAASLGAFDVVNNKFKINNLRLPGVSSEFKVAGEYRGVPVSVALGDNQASFIGSVRSADYALLNVGTGSQISFLIDDYSEIDGVELRPFDGKRFLCAGCSLCGGRAFAMFEKFCREIASLSGADIDSFYPALDRLLENKLSSEIKADCRFCGTRKDPSVKGGYFGITENNFNVSEFAFSTLEGIADELYGFYKASGAEKKAVVCSGNGIRKNPVLCRIVENMFKAEIKLPCYEEEAAFGAALSASVAVGEFSSIDEACSIIKYRGE